MKKLSLEKLIPCQLILLAWSLFIVPSVPGSEWFYLDDPSVLQIGHSFFHNPHWLLPFDQSGRYTPATWLYQGLCWEICGNSPPGFFFLASLVILATGFLAFGIGKRLSGSSWGGVLAGVLFFTCSPMAEVAYTLGKGEPLQLCLLLLSCLLCIQYYRSASDKAWVWLGLMVLAQMLCVWSKETGTWIILAFAFVTSALFLLTERSLNQPSLKAKALRSGLFSMAAVISARLPYYLFRPANSQETYLSYKLTWSLVLGNLHTYLSRQPDVFLMAILATSLTCITWWNLRRAPAEERKPVVFAFGILAAGWFIFSAMLIWRMALSYYFYPAAAAFEIVAGAILVKAHLNRTGSKALLWISLALIMMAKLYALPYGYYVGRVQKATAEAYGATMKEYVALAKNGERLFVEAWTAEEEPTYQSNLLVNAFRRPKSLIVVGIQDVLTGASLKPHAVAGLGQDRILASKGEWPRPGDFVLVECAKMPASWFVRAVAPLITHREPAVTRFGYDLKPIFEIKKSYRCIYPPAGSLAPVFDEIYRQYKIFRIVAPDGASGEPGVIYPDFAPAGSPWWMDGWVPQYFAVHVLIDPARPTLRISGEIPGALGQCAMRVVTHDQQLLSEIDLGAPGRFEREISLVPALSGFAGKHVLIHIQSSSAIDPGILGQIGERRNLSWRLIQLQLVPRKGAG